MYFDYSRRKLWVLGSTVVILTAAAASSFAVVAANADRLDRGEERLSRTWSNAVYWLSFKLPEQGQVALAAVGLSARAGDDSPTLPLPAGTAKSVPVLLYHGDGGARSSISRALFVEHMRTLHRAGWRTITMAQFSSFMQGETSVPEKSFLLTFDDGRADTFYSVDPVLKELDYYAVMFVITGLSLPNNGPHAVNGYYLDTSELAFMLASGRWGLESHGDQDHRGYAVPVAASTSEVVGDKHFLSNIFWIEGAGRSETDAEYTARVRDDLARSQELLKSNFGVPATAFAYPFNDFGQESANFPGATERLARIVPSLYTFAFYQTWPGNGDSFNYPDPGAFFIKRIEPTNDMGGTDMLATLAGGESKPLSPGETRLSLRDWQANWGTVTVTETGLALTADPDTTGAAAFLDGTEAWRDYRLAAEAAIEHGTLSLIARHTETEAPYLVCAFSNDTIYLECHVGAEQTTLARARYRPPPLPATFEVSMQVAGNTASCRAYGVSVTASVAGIVRAGGVGMSIWSPGHGEARAILTALSVTPTGNP